MVSPHVDSSCYSHRSTFSRREVERGQHQRDNDAPDSFMHVKGNRVKPMAIVAPQHVLPVGSTKQLVSPRAASHASEARLEEDRTLDIKQPRLEKHSSNSSPAPQLNHVIDGDTVAIAEYSKVCGFDASDGKVLHCAYRLLAEANCYYGKLSMQDARLKLKSCALGTYLLRDSSDQQHLFSLSVKTGRGTTSIRIAYRHGHFMLDCEEALARRMPTFPCILRLLEYYTQLTSSTSICVFLESSGRRDTTVLLSRPRVHTVASLKSLVRKKLNMMLSVDQRRKLLLFMPPDVERFMLEYRYTI